MPGLGMKVARGPVWAASVCPTKYPFALRQAAYQCNRCNVDVYLRAGYEHPNSKNWVYAIFRLGANGKHNAGCAYDVATTIASFVANAHNITDLTGKPLIEVLAQHRYRFRLKSLSDAFGISPTVPGPAGQLGSTRSRPIANRKHLLPYLFLASGLAKLYLHLRDEIDPHDLGSLISISFGKLRLAWDDFVFDEGRRKELLLSSSLWPTPALARPFAVTVTPSKSGPRKNGKPGLSVQCSAVYLNGVAYRVDLITDNWNTLQHLVIGRRSMVIALNAWRYRDAEASPNSTTLGVRIVEPAQVAVM